MSHNNRYFLLMILVMSCAVGGTFLVMKIGSLLWGLFVTMAIYTIGYIWIIKGGNK